MALIQLVQVNKRIISRDLLQDVSLQIMPGEKVGLIGQNGVGKTTLFRILLTDEEPDSGQVVQKNNLEVGYMAQDFFFRDEDITLYGFMEEAFAHLLQLEKALRSLEELMGEDPNEGENQKIMHRYASLMQRFQEEGGYTYQSRIRGVLQGLGFPGERFQSPLSSFSGGEKSRAELGRLLLQEPDLLFLDEPTNHLDIRTREWLEEFLSTYQPAVMVISHDRYFLNQTVHRILELEAGRLEKYPGGFSHYQQEKIRRLRYWETEYEKQQEEISRDLEFIRRNHAGNNAGQARSRKKQLENRKRIPPPPPRPSLPKITFPSSQSSGKEVLQVKGVSHSFPGKDILSRIHLQVQRGEKIVLLGDNGSGKTTFFQILLGMLSPTRGEIQYGVRVKIAAYLQEHENLAAHRTILEEIQAHCAVGQEEARSALGRFLFSQEDWPKQVGELSGGERSRLALAKLTLTPSNLLLLDEPTNHLDFLSRGPLEKAVQEYPGTCIIISHDRFFINAVADTVWALSQGKIRSFPGNYTYYQEKIAEEAREKKNEEKKEPAQRKIPPRPSTKKGQKKGKKMEILEEEIISREEELVRLEGEFAKSSFYGQEGKVIEERKKTYDGLKKELEVLYEKWEEGL